MVGASPPVTLVKPIPIPLWEPSGGRLEAQLICDWFARLTWPFRKQPRKTAPPQATQVMAQTMSKTYGHIVLTQGEESTHCILCFQEPVTGLRSAAAQNNSLGDRGQVFSSGFNIAQLGSSPHRQSGSSRRWWWVWHPFGNSKQVFHSQCERHSLTSWVQSQTFLGQCHAAQPGSPPVSEVRSVQGSL